jgi:hypothetical protein
VNASPGGTDHDEQIAAFVPREVGEGCLDCPHPDYCAGMGKCEIGATKIAARDDVTAAKEPGWLVIESYTGKVVTEYDTREEAKAAVEWYRKTYPMSASVEYCRADA